MLHTNDCPPEATLIYTIEENRTLASFRPDTLTFTTIDKIDCVTKKDDWIPFSMAVQRDGTAWVLFSSADFLDSALFQVDVKTAHCTPTAFSHRPGDPLLFGMGFALDDPGGTDETLFIAEYIDVPMLPPLRLMSLSLSDFQFTPHGFTDGDAELTSTPDANLFGYFPGFDQASGPRFERIDKTSGNSLQTFPIGDVKVVDDLAVAAWGGSFWLFVGTGLPSRDSSVFQWTEGTPTAKQVVADSSRVISGAGVSTCKTGP
jgi:hypothetical protein